MTSHLGTVADFAMEMFDVLDSINYQSYNEFVLRVGRLAGRRPLGVPRGARCNYPIVLDILSAAAVKGSL